MSSVKADEVMAKNLQKSHSSSSLLLSSANLAWTPTSSLILAAPQPELDRPGRPSSESSKALTNEELIQSLRTGDSTATSDQSLDVSDGFQTISLNDNKADDQSSVASNHSSSSAPVYTQKTSLLDKLFSPITTTRGRTSGRSSPQAVGHEPTNQSSAPTLTAETTQLSSDNGYSSHITASYSSPNFFGSTEHSTTPSSAQDITPVPTYATPSAPPAPPQPPTLPPKELAKDFRIRGPLRLYDPNHGIGQSSPASAPTQTPIAGFAAPEVNPFIPPVVSPDVIYNPNDYLSTASQPIASNVSTDVASSETEVSQQQSGQQSEPTIGVETDPNQAYDWQNSNPQPFSFISESQTQQDFNSYNPNPNPSATPTEWTPTAQTADQSTALYPDYQPMTMPYQPVEHHWFYQKIVENKEVWLPFSMYDSYNLEQALLQSGAANGYGLVIPTDGGRFDVSVYDRLRRPVYWSEVDTIVRRCSWFYKKEGHKRWSPYPEDLSIRLEEAYRLAVFNNAWNQHIELESGTEVVIMHSSQSVWHYQKDHGLPDGWGQAVENPTKPRLVHRGALDGIFDDIDEGEPEKIDHLLFLVHGVGEFCDFSFRSIVEVVDDFREISLTQMRTHFKSYLESGELGRIELLPISWHSALHGDETGIDDRLKQITLESIPKLRHFTNDTILDALFYTSPVYCQTIVESVGQELNRLFALFCQRNPEFAGSVALGGHSLGSLIVFDLLAHQTPNDDNHNNDNSGHSTDQTLSDIDRQLCQYFALPVNQSVEMVVHSLGFAEYVNYLRDIDFHTMVTLTEDDLKLRLHDLPTDLVKKLTDFVSKYQRFQLIPTEANSPINSYPFESIGSPSMGFPAIRYPKLSFRPSAFFAMGSPIPMFMTVRGVQQLSPDYRLPTCSAVFNIYHPYDPIAYRLEPLIHRSFKDIKPVLIPHHKGRKRMHLELRDSIVRMGSDIKSKIYDSLKYTWNSINDFARAHKSSDREYDNNDNNGSNDTNGDHNQDIDHNQNNYSLNSDYDHNDDQSMGYGQSVSAGALNSGRRIDYVLQESPVEAFNEYLFAIRAHACYWQSEDTALLILRELYRQIGYYSSQPTAQTTTEQSVSPTQTSSASSHNITYNDNELTEQHFN